MFVSHVGRWRGKEWRLYGPTKRNRQGRVGRHFGSRLAKAKQLAKEKGVDIETELADLNEIDFGEEQWDCIVSIFCHLPPPVRQRVFAQIPNL